LLLPLPSLLLLLLLSKRLSSSTSNCCIVFAPSQAAITSDSEPGVAVTQQN
jgi:hypothetical protein